MTYSATDIEDALTRYGELMVVLDSDREYALHPHDTEFRSDGTIYSEGILEGGTEYLKVEFPAGAVEHFYSHSEL